jgi:hypothetical protein
MNLDTLDVELLLESRFYVGVGLTLFETYSNISLDGLLVTGLESLFGSSASCPCRSSIRYIYLPFITRNSSS